MSTETRDRGALLLPVSGRLGRDNFGRVSRNSTRVGLDYAVFVLDRDGARRLHALGERALRLARDMGLSEAEVGGQIEGLEVYWGRLPEDHHESMVRNGKVSRRDVPPFSRELLLAEDQAAARPLDEELLQKLEDDDALLDRWDFAPLTVGANANRVLGLDLSNRELSLAPIAWTNVLACELGWAEGERGRDLWLELRDNDPALALDVLEREGSRLGALLEAEDVVPLLVHTDRELRERAVLATSGLDEDASLSRPRHPEDRSAREPSRR